MKRLFVFYLDQNAITFTKLVKSYFYFFGKIGLIPAKIRNKNSVKSKPQYRPKA